MKRLVAVLLGLVVAVGAMTAPGAFAQAPKDATKGATKDAATASKDAAKSTTGAAKDAAKAPLVDINAATPGRAEDAPGDR